MRFNLVTIVLILTTACSNQNASQPDFYFDFVSVSVGPSKYDNVSGRFNRVLINNKSGRLNLIVEKILTDDEGFDKRLDKRIVINNLNFGSETIYDIHVTKWVDTDTFLVNKDNECYMVEVIPDDVRVIKGCNNQ
ncbi:hypothetical protein FNH22_10290 [Fulvivirga sp. M361]|uniref:hypothetical protein n=1 Tax=Fulvivirga sp. M361 TaxID=2594266 RepID=UPI00117B41D2|nr:hypothetical protein [Fulvivirga sp. M361]TRX59533.1 hypothetical protein FNH22_10290 [Fulvivirga sp. M361]